MCTKLIEVDRLGSEVRASAVSSFRTAEIRKLSGSITVRGRCPRGNVQGGEISFARRRRRIRSRRDEEMRPENL